MSVIIMDSASFITKEINSPRIVIFMEAIGHAVRITHCKKRLSIFPSPGEMSLTKLSLAGNNKNFPGQGEFGQ
jgi:hypothetical protein